MISSSPWPIRICLVSAAALTLGASLPLDLPTVAGQDIDQTLSAQDDDRGSGRLQPRTKIIKVSYRGSGRVRPDSDRPAPLQKQFTFTAYRGSGRIQPIDPAQS